ncbi:MAG: NAD(P)/FAD-dependent oxidoreductase [Planctomycetes bacterium]|nr:NAD(P)/FAD-dependent oxidoreductase [Planctomycetota bacterium]
MHTTDVLVIGAGFGGLGCALELARRGVDVTLVEALNYPGGCASTFHRGGFAFQSGATLCSGLGADQLFDRWIQEERLDVLVDWLDPVVELRTPEGVLEIPRDRERFVAELCRRHPEKHAELQRFFTLQRRVAQVVWPALDDPSLLPPLTLHALLRHVRRAHHFWPLMRWCGRSLEQVLRHLSLHRLTPFVRFLDALCQITIQCSTKEAEAPFALSVLEFFFRGTGHVRGGLGALAWELARAVERRGGQVRFASRVTGLTRDGDSWLATARHGPIRARRIVADVLPHTLRTWLGGSSGSWRARLERAVDTSWGAGMLYLAVRDPSNDPPKHVEIVQDLQQPFTAGNHLFCSAMEPMRAADGTPYRSITVSTHVPLQGTPPLETPWWKDRMDEIHQLMWRGLARFAPEWNTQRLVEMTASPRTFERFTGRPRGRVGGVPRRRSLAHYRSARILTWADDLYLVGDSAFPGQSTLATALGGVKVAERLAR